MNMVEIIFYFRQNITKPSRLDSRNKGYNDIQESMSP